jgi:NitT/TauT family transport system substrate-binding protein
MNFSKGKSIFVILLLIVTGVSIGAYYYEQAQKNRYDVTIAYLEGDLHQLAYYVAKEKGFYNDAGLNVSGIAHSNGGAVMNSFAAGQIDMGYLGFAPVVFQRFANPKAQVTVLSAVNIEGTALIVKNTPSIQNASDLLGKKIAVPVKNNMQDFILSMILDLAELTKANLTITEMSVATMPLALAANEIDGYVAWEPFAVKGLNNSIGKYLYNSSDIWANHPCCVLAAHNDFLDVHPEIAEKVVEVHIKTTKWILSHWDEAMEIAMAKMNLNREQASTAMDNIGFVYEFNTTQMISFVDKVTQYNPNTNYTSPGIPSNVTNSTSFINWVVNASIMEKVKK